MYKALIFDMDGVLVDSMPYHTEAIGNVFDSMGIGLDKQDIYEMEGSKTVEIIAHLLEKEGIEPDAGSIEDIVREYRREFSRIVEYKAFASLKNALPTLKGRFLLAVVSGADRNIVHDVISRLFGDIFDLVISGEDVINGKPAPDPFLVAAKGLGLGPEDCVVIENASMGVKAAKSAGMFCIGIPTYVTPISLDDADLLVKDHDVLTDTLLGMEHPGMETVRELRALKE